MLEALALIVTHQASSATSGGEGVGIASLLLLLVRRRSVIETLLLLPRSPAFLRMQLKRYNASRARQRHRESGGGGEAHQDGEPVSLQRVEAAQRWLLFLQQQPPLQLLQLLLFHLTPQLERFALRQQSLGLLSDAEAETEVFAFLGNASLVGLLPPQQPLLVHKSHPNAQTTSWTTACIWAMLFLRVRGLFESPFIALFNVK